MVIKIVKEASIHKQYSLEIAAECADNNLFSCICNQKNESL